jgi:hypothetical protein
MDISSQGRCFNASNSETSTPFQSPATAPSSASLMGVFGKRLSERSEFPIAAHEAEPRRKQAVGGSLLFGYFFLAKQEKVTRQSRESDLLLTVQCLPVIAPY